MFMFGHRVLLLFEKVYMGHAVTNRYVAFDRQYHSPQGSWSALYKRAADGKTQILSGPARQKQVTRDSDKRQEK